MPMGEELLLGRDADGIVAVSWTWEEDGPGLVKFLAAAVARRAWGTGVSDALIAETIDRTAARADAAGLDHFLIYGLIHPNNANSQAMVARHQFTYMRDDDDHQEWVLRVDFNP
ncbi:hypothetical protein D0Z08_05835 [Nocardioides immobilis]|uniref:GNAT family N-acetyltransferase n=2 Tax=Nocardioides immobilis TaxID=2049295 RepID=A0A417Y5F8_9ACTN|nr:hypothetical protein D0Z08_05835 [Nocardioides immobilis]